MTVAGGELSVVVLNRFPCERDALVRVLERDGRIRVAGHAETDAEGIAFARELQPDVVIVDLLSLESSPVTWLTVLRQEVPSARALAWTDGDTAESLLDAVRAHAADGYLSKRAGADDVIAAVTLVHEGAGVVTPALAAWLLRHSANQVEEKTGWDALSPREREIARLLATGRTDREIAAQLGLSPRTIHHHLARVRAKAGLNRRAELALWAASQESETT